MNKNYIDRLFLTYKEHPLIISTTKTASKRDSIIGHVFPVIKNNLNVSGISQKEVKKLKQRSSLQQDYIPRHTPFSLLKRDFFSFSSSMNSRVMKKKGAGISSYFPRFHTDAREVRLPAKRLETGVNGFQKVVKSFVTSFVKSDKIESKKDVNLKTFISNEKNTLSRFSLSLLQSGKKVSGHKILLQSLFLLRQNHGPSIFLKKTSEQSFLLKKKIRQSKILPLYLCKYTKKVESFISLLPSNFFYKNSTIFDKSNRENNTPKRSSALNWFFIKDENEKETRNKNYHLFRSSFKKSTAKVEHKLFASEDVVSKSLCTNCVKAVQPILETRKVRKGRVTYKVPKVTLLQRQKGKAIKFLKEYAVSRKKGDLKNFKIDYSGSSIPELKTSFFLSPQSALFLGDRESKTVETQSQKANLNLQKNEISFLNLPPSSFNRSSFCFTNLGFVSTSCASPKVMHNSFAEKKMMNRIKEEDAIELKKKGHPLSMEKSSVILSSPDLFLKNKKDSVFQKVIKQNEIKTDKTSIPVISPKSPFFHDSNDVGTESYPLSFLFSNNIFSTTLDGVGTKRNHFLYTLRKPILKDCLSECFFESGNGKGESIEKKKSLHLLALQNRAYLHFRWW